ncbi:MAG: transcriptional regulator, LuxR family [Actinomycetia bacterium]|nr:transcriptional regulator, LuxR family [Actinomycetes bacterium]
MDRHPSTAVLNWPTDLDSLATALHVKTGSPALRHAGAARRARGGQALHQLLVPFMPLLPTLPAPQRDAMMIAFGLKEGPPPDLFLVGLAALTLLSLAAEDQPVLCLIDDGHWLDRESAHALGFVARRLYADRLGFIASVGESPVPEVVEGLATVTVGGCPTPRPARNGRWPWPTRNCGSATRNKHGNGSAPRSPGSPMTSPAAWPSG